MTNQDQNTISPAANIYHQFSKDICILLENARRSAGRAVNAILTASYWEIGRRIVEFEQKGKKRAEYGSALLKNLSEDLSNRFGKGFSYSVNIWLDYGKKSLKGHNVVPDFLLQQQSVFASDPF